MTGLGLESFTLYSTAILNLYQNLGTCLPPSSLLPWKPVTQRGFLSLDFANRYFSSINDYDNSPAIELSKDIDPFGILGNVVTDGRHTSDNDVQYYERKASSKPG